MELNAGYETGPPLAGLECPLTLFDVLMSAWNASLERKPGTALPPNVPFHICYPQLVFHVTSLLACS